MIKKRKLEGIVNYKKMFKEADLVQPEENETLNLVMDKVVKYLKGLAFPNAKIGLAIDVIKHLLNEIRIEGDKFTSTESETLKKIISKILKREGEDVV